MRKFTLLIVILFITFLLNGCGEKNKTVLARINGDVITLEDFNKRISRLPGYYQEIIKGQKAQFLDDIIMEDLLYKEALKSKIDRDPETKEVIAEAKKKILVSRLIKDRVDDKISAFDQDIRKYYDEHSEEFMLPERWRASHILVDTQEEAEAIKERLNQGASFEELAKEKSKDATSQQGGDVGYFSKGQLIPEFEGVCLSLEVGEISDIVKTKFGYHIIKLTDKKSPEVQEFSSVKELIKKELERDKKKQLLEALMNNLRRDVKITVNKKLIGEEAKGKKETKSESAKENK
jgi:peptidyl-prolyl cis-trans isomerase C